MICKHIIKVLFVVGCFDAICYLSLIFNEIIVVPCCYTYLFKDTYQEAIASYVRVGGNI